MSHSNDPIIKPFSLETYDGSEDGSARGKGTKQGSRSKEGKVQMDTSLSEDVETTKPKVKFNLNFDRYIALGFSTMHRVFAVVHLKTHHSDFSTEWLERQREATIRRKDLIWRPCLRQCPVGMPPDCKGLTSTWSAH